MIRVVLGVGLVVGMAPVHARERGEDFEKTLLEARAHFASRRPVGPSAGKDWFDKFLFGYLSDEDIVPGTTMQLGEIGARVAEAFKARGVPLNLKGEKMVYYNVFVPKTRPADCDLRLSERNSPTSAAVDCRRPGHPEIIDTEDVLDLARPDSGRMEDGKIRLRYLNHSGPFELGFFGAYLAVNPETFAIEGLEIWKDDVYFGNRGNRVIYELRAAP